MYKKQLKPINGFIKHFPNIHKFCNNNFNKFILLIRKGVYTYESWIVVKDLMKPHFQMRKLFIVNYI